MAGVNGNGTNKWIMGVMASMLLAGGTILWASLGEKNREQDKVLDTLQSIGNTQHERVVMLEARMTTCERELVKEREDLTYLMHRMDALAAGQQGQGFNYPR